MKIPWKNERAAFAALVFGLIMLIAVGVKPWTDYTQLQERIERTTTQIDRIDPDVAHVKDVEPLSSSHATRTLFLSGILLSLLIVLGSLLMIYMGLKSRVREKERFRFAAECSSDVIYEWNLKERIDWIGDVDAMQGFENGEFPRTLQRWLEFVHPDDRQKVNMAINGELDGYRSNAMEYRVRRRDGSWNWWLTRGVAIRSGGRTVRWIGVVKNRTIEKQLEDALILRNRISHIFLTIRDEEMFNEVLKVILDVMESPFGVFGYIDEEGDLVVPTMTRQIWDQCNVPEKSIRFPRNTWTDSIWPTAIREKQAKYSNVPSDKTPQGHVVVTRNIAMPILFHDEVIGLLQVANKASDYTDADMERLRAISEIIAPILHARIKGERIQTALFKLNEELEDRIKLRTAELEQLNGELDAFSYSVSHDLRAPLRAIDGFGRILREEHEECLNEEGRRILDIITGQTQQMGKLIESLIDYARMGKKKIDVTDVQCTPLVENAYYECLSHMKERNVHLDLVPLPPAQGDTDLLRIVWYNLLSNAIKFTQTRRPGSIRVRGVVQNGEVIYSIQDNGVGFDSKYADKMFGVFQRLHSSKEFEGTGIGLAMVKGIVQRHGGRVWAEGMLNEGTTVFFSLPQT